MTRSKRVVKADGLRGGKGVIVEGDHFVGSKQAKAFAAEAIEKFGRAVLEEKLVGVEFSLMSISDGKTVLHTVPVQDHKRAYNGDEGPNTGGMGTISGAEGMLPFLTPEIVAEAEQLNTNVISVIKETTGQPYIGVLFGGFMRTASGLKLIEYNCRFGDPESLNVLTLLQTDFSTVVEKAVTERLHELGKLDFDPRASVCHYLCPEGYPTNSVKNVPITAPTETESESGVAYFASVAKMGSELHLKGSRAVGCVGLGDTMTVAYAEAVQLKNQFGGQLFSRSDIGTKALTDSRTEYMNHLLDG